MSMTELDDTKTTGPEGIERPHPAPGSPTFGIVAMAVGVGYLVILFLFGFFGVLLAVPACVTVLAGLVSVLADLARWRARGAANLRRHVVALVAILGLALFLFPGLGTIRTLNLHCRMRVAVTGGQEELQAWAMELMAKPRDQIEVSAWSGEGDYEWTVPKQHWSKQVRRLNPKRIRIERSSMSSREIVRLMYGGGFVHWNISIGSAAAIEDLAVRMKAADYVWFRWSDGICCWFPD
jgi:hypothetical protein